MLGTCYGPEGTGFSYSRDPVYSNSRDMIINFFDSRDPNLVPKTPQKKPGNTLRDNALDTHTQY